MRVAASRSSIAASSASIPSPVSAETRKHGRSGGRRAAIFRRFSRSSAIEAIDLVPDFENALPRIGIDAELAQHGIDVALLRIGVLMRDIADVENDIGFQHFLQRRAKRRHQLRRQVGDEADRVRQHRLAAMRQTERAQRRIERRKQHVGGLHVGAGQAVEQRRLSGIGVADQRHHAVRHPLPAGAMQPPRRLDLLDFVLKARDALADQAAIGFDLGFAGTAHEPETAALALQMGPRPHQAAALIIQMRQFDLQRAFLGLGAAAEDFEDQPGAVEDLGVPGLLEIALLDRRQRAIHHHQFDLVPGDEPDDLLDLALAEIGRGPDLADRRDQRLRDRQIDGARQTDGFLEPRLGIADGMRIRLRLGIAAAHAQIGADDDHPPGLLARCRPRTVGTPFKISGFQSDHSQAGASSPPSNNWIGAPGMMVEIACL